MHTSAFNTSPQLSIHYWSQVHEGSKLFYNQHGRDLCVMRLTSPLLTKSNGWQSVRHGGHPWTSSSWSLRGASVAFSPSGAACPRATTVQVLALLLRRAAMHSP